MALLVRALIFLAVGLALGVAQTRSLRENERLFRKNGERARPTVIFMFWLLVLAVVFLTLARSGPSAFVPAMLGYLAARIFAGGERPRPPPPPSF